MPADQTSRPVFIPPDVDWVFCYICGDETAAENVAGGLDVSPEDEYYPDMKPLCPRCHER